MFSFRGPMFSEPTTRLNQIFGFLHLASKIFHKFFYMHKLAFTAFVSIVVSITRRLHGIIVLHLHETCVPFLCNFVNIQVTRKFMHFYLSTLLQMQAFHLGKLILTTYYGFIHLLSGMQHHPPSLPVPMKKISAAQ